MGVRWGQWRENTRCLHRSVLLDRTGYGPRAARKRSRKPSRRHTSTAGRKFLSAQTEFLIDSTKIAEYLIYGKTPDPVVKTQGVVGQMGPLGVELLCTLLLSPCHKSLKDFEDLPGLVW
jgi:hypothetical protein